MRVSLNLPITAIARKQTNKMNSIKKAMPIVAAPILAYYIGEGTDRNTEEILDFLKRKNIKIPDYLKPHADTKSGLNAPSKDKIKETLQKAYEKGEITQKEHERYTRKLTFTGNEEAAEQSSVHSDGEVDYGNEYPVYEETEVADVDDGGIVETIEEVASNPWIAGVAAEIIPVARFIKPCVDLSNGDTEKAAIGAVTRGIDLVASPLKLLLATTKGLSDAIIGAAFDDKDYNFKDGFTGFYKDWAEGRDAIEDGLLGRQSKEEALKKQDELKKQKMLESIRQREAERERKDELLKQQAKPSQQQSEKVSQQPQHTEIRKTTPTAPKSSMVSIKERLYFEKKQKEFSNMLSRYQKLKPNANIQNFENWENWNQNKLETNMNLLKRMVKKAEKRK